MLGDDLLDWAGTVLMLRHRGSQSGFFLVEALAMMLLLAILGFAFTKSAQMAILLRSKSARHATAMEIAVDKMEEISGIDPSTLDDSSDSLTTVVRDGRAFSLAVDVTVNGDGSREVAIEVSGGSILGGSASLEKSLPLWGSV